MTSIKHLFAAAGVATLTAFTALAAPNAQYVPANADMVFTVDAPVGYDPAVEKVWMDGLSKLGIDAGNTQAQMAALEQEVPGLPALLRALFASGADWKTCEVKSATGFFALESIDPETGNFVCTLGLMVENPKADTAAIQDAFEKMLAANEAKEITLAARNQWTEIKLACSAPEDVQENPFNFIGFASVPKGYLMVAAPTYEAAEALRAGTAPKLAKDNPLKKAFAKNPSAKTNQGIVAIKDLSGFINQHIPAKELAEAKKRLPLLFKLHSILYSVVSNGLDYTVSITVDTDAESTATEIGEMLMGYKAMARQMFIPMMMQTDKSKLAELVGNLKILPAGKTLKLTLQTSANEILAILGELQALQQRTQQQTADDVEIEGVDELFKDDEEMTPEAAESILDALED